jgi:bifunctional ADP-heptose synthase (sugar kinase/adenylyltransferase)
VTIFTGKRVTEVIRLLKPAVYAKGGDYTPETLDPGEKGALDEVGAEIRILQLVPGRSTTAILEKSRVS